MFYMCDVNVVDGSAKPMSAPIETGTYKKYVSIGTIISVIAYYRPTFSLFVCEYMWLTLRWLTSFLRVETVSFSSLCRPVLKGQ